MSQLELLPPTAFGKWGRLARVGDVAFGNHSRAERLRWWLMDRMHGLPAQSVLNVLVACDSGAEVVFALTFAPSVHDLRVLDDHTLAYNDETLALQQPIPHSPYIADFVWTRGLTSCLVEIYGQAAHRERITTDRARHRHLTGLGHVVHYLPAELVVRHPRDGWNALREREWHRRQAAAPTMGVAA